MRFHDARIDGHSRTIVLLAHIYLVRQKHQRRSLGHKYSPINCIQQPEHALCGQYSFKIWALSTVHVDRTYYPRHRRGSMSADTGQQSSWSMDRVPSSVRAWV